MLPMRAADKMRDSRRLATYAAFFPSSHSLSALLASAVTVEGREPALFPFSFARMILLEPFLGPSAPS
jgi:hypothetical protein